MDFINTFKALDQHRPFLDNTQYDPNAFQHQYTPPQDNQSMEQMYAMFQTSPPLYNIDGYISPYPSNNWDMSTTLMNFLQDESRLPPLEQKVDPNKIFSSDIAALRTLAADQSKITKMFERKLVESLTDKGKFGLTEDDIAAMQALTTARSAITAINKEQISIKKNIAELKIKQQAGGAVGTASGAPASIGRNSNPMDIGRSIMDSLFEMPSSQTPQVSSYQTQEVSLDKASEVIDSVLPNAVSQQIQLESAEPKTYVVLGETDDDATYETYGSDGNIIQNYPNPTAKINSVDRQAKKAYDENLNEYDIIFKE